MHWCCASTRLLPKKCKRLRRRARHGCGPCPGRGRCSAVAKSRPCQLPARRTGQALALFCPALPAALLQQALNFAIERGASGAGCTCAGGTFYQKPRCAADSGAGPVSGCLAVWLSGFLAFWLSSRSATALALQRGAALLRIHRSGQAGIETGFHQGLALAGGRCTSA